MPSNEKEVYEYIGSDRSTTLELDFLTYAIFSFNKYEWYQHFESIKLRPPNQEEIDDWIGELPDSRFTSMREDAARFFDNAARLYMKDEIEREKKSAVDGSIVAEVRAAGAWWRQLGIALITAILAPIIIGGIIVFAIYYDRVVPTATDMSHILAPNSHTTDAH